MPLSWTLHGDGKAIAPDAIVAPGERLSWPRTIGIGAQHVVAMFGATFLVPLITHFPPATTLLFSGIGTLLFLVITGNRLPSYLGSSFAFLAPIAAAMGAKYSHTAALPSALFGIVAVGVVLALVGLLVIWTGTRWIDLLMPPVVAGAIVALIGFNLAPTAGSNFLTAPLTAAITLAAIVLIAVLFRGLIGRLSIFLGVVVGWIAAALQGQVDLSAVGSAAWVGLPEFHLPANPFDGSKPTWSLLAAFLPIVLALIAENVGHIRAVAAMSGQPELNRLTGRALFADGLSTTLAGLFGGSGTTTYGENIGTMAATRVYSTAAYWVAGVFAILLGLCPKVGAVIYSIPSGVLGGATVALYGLIGVIGIKIWIDNKVDFSKPRNQFTAAIALVIGIADITLTFGRVQIAGIAFGAIAAILVYHAMTWIGRVRGTS
ncbi:uracil-xanthine permease family protein [Gryllotalpicola ginsengisoli]|uniref:uracil-xanthine permease family protein n=1 Tax=Gryllotalpicola ginsengisoli TaxID=444608 RepID=UPI0003B4F775|nr:solute carrier family 23 protein [Gryllotalpicola ginsengisoli]